MLLLTAIYFYYAMCVMYSLFLCKYKQRVHIIADMFAIYQVMLHVTRKRKSFMSICMYICCLIYQIIAWSFKMLTPLCIKLIHYSKNFQISFTWWIFLDLRNAIRQLTYYRALMQKTKIYPTCYILHRFKIWHHIEM